MKTRSTIIALLVVFNLVLPNAPVLADSAGDPEGAIRVEHVLSERFRQVAEEEQFGPGTELRLGKISESYYPLTDLTLFHAKVTDLRTGRIVGISLDPAGRVVDGEEALRREEQARRDTYGKLEPSLHERLSDLPEDSTAMFPVSIWLHMEPVAPSPDRPWFLKQSKPYVEKLSASVPLRFPVLDNGISAYDYPAPEPEVTVAQVTAELRKESERVKVVVAEAQRPLLAFLQERGCRVDGVSEYVSVVYVTLAKPTILEVQDREDVQLVALVQRAKDCMDIAKLATYADYAWDMGLTGKGVRVGVIEVNGRVAVDNPYLRGVVQDAQNVCSATKDHNSAVTGMIRSRHVRYRGISYGSLVRVGGSCGGWLSELRSAAERAIDWGARLLNNSWGHLDPKGEMGAGEKYWDSLVWNHRVTVCFAAGNTGRTYADAYVGHPALAYNLISVGAYDDHNTTSWSDDTMADFSSFRDPSSANGDREKPELCAPGVSINSTSVRSPWVTNCGQGTSYSSPIVTGAAALMMQEAPELLSWPEAVKAILMASAINNIEYDWKMEGRDGAGGIDAQEASTKVTKRHAWGAGYLSPADFDAYDDYYINISLPVADKARAVIVWCVDPNYANYPSRPQADFDLYWLDNEGYEITNSESGDNNFEVVGVYDVAPAGWRTLRVHAYRMPSQPLRFAWAVHWWDD